MTPEDLMMWAYAIALTVVLFGGLLAAVVAIAAYGIAVFVKWRDERKKRGGGR